MPKQKNYVHPAISFSVLLAGLSLAGIFYLIQRTEAIADNIANVNTRLEAIEMKR